MDIREFLLLFSSIMGPGLSFVLYATVLIAGWRFIKDGTVGQMTMTFYSLGCFNGCVWALYSVLIESKTLAIPNAFALFATCFALVSYLHVLRSEVKAAESRRDNHQHDDDDDDDDRRRHDEMGKIDDDGSRSRVIVTAAAAAVRDYGSTAVEKDAKDMGVVGADGTANGEKDSISSSLPKTAIVETKLTNNGDDEASNGATISSDASSETAAVVTTHQHHQQHSYEHYCERAAEFQARYAYAKRSSAVILGANAVTCLIIILICGMGNQSTAIAISGTMGVIMENILFTGPLDEIKWILSHKNSAPLDPLMTTVGAIDCGVWIIYALLTSDVYLFIPNAFSVTLCLIQLGLILKFPARNEEDDDD